MKEFFLYIVQFSISLAALYAVYWVFLRKDTFFTVNRFYLLGAILFSFIIPFINIPYVYNGSDSTFLILLETVTVTTENVEKSLVEYVNVYQSIFIVYITGVCIFFFRLLFQLLQLSILVNKYGIRKKDGLRFVYLNKDYVPFSYFNIIFLNKSCDQNKDIDQIIEHEKVHIRQYHSIDIMVLEFLTILQWFNPIVWLCKYSLKEIHEYLADEGAVADGYDRYAYQNLLLNQTVGMQLNDLTNNFNHSLIKRRIIMLTKLKSNRRQRLKFLMVLPVAFGLVFGSATKIVKAENNPVQPNLEQEKNKVKKEKKVVRETVFILAETKPEFLGKDKEIHKFISKNIKYPEEARKKGIQGKVYTRFTITKTGEIKNVKVVKGIGHGCDKEAVRVVKLMPKWKPGTVKGKKVNVEYNLPINFKLD